MLSTVGYWTGKDLLEASLTTPDIDLINAILGESIDAGAEYATMEVSSHALDQGRVWGLKFAGAGFTNLSVDHLDYHGNLIEYSTAKERLFRSLPMCSTACINVNSSWGCRMVRASMAPVITVGSEDSGADLRVRLREHTVAGGAYQLDWMGRQFDVSTRLVGLYQGENLALAAALAFSSEIDPSIVVKGIANLRAVPGRMEAVDVGQPFSVFVDYAHTPDALERAIRSLRPLTKGRILVMFGCGGDRDRSKRPQMGRISATEADVIVITSDNPRTEDPASITSEIFAGVSKELAPKVAVNTDRREATLQIIRKAEAGDVVLLAGKGSEWYQEINGVRHPYDDRLIATEALEEIGYRAGER
jgi:UDP-N-acetylmuramoyl-L-alanyl-D-glutamate--2,6-diaminopimelate ligase